MRVPDRLPASSGAPTAASYLRADSLLGPVVNTVGFYQIEPVEGMFARLIHSIVRQQISMAAADTIFSRLCDHCELTPTSIRKCDRASLADVGLSTQKVSSIQAAATMFESEEWDRATFSQMENDAVIDALTRIDGIGIWTAKMQLIFTLARPDVFPVEDLGVRQAIQDLRGEDYTHSELEELARRWRPYRSMAAIYLWAYSESDD